MNQISNPIKETILFFVLTLGIVFFVFWGPLALFGIPGPSLEAGNSGPPWAVVLFVLGGFTPSLVALFLTWRADGRTGLRALAKRLNPRTVSIKWHLAILFVIGLAPPPTAYQILQYVPYIIIAVVVTAVWGAKTLTRGRNLAKKVTA